MNILIMLVGLMYVAFFVVIGRDSWVERIYVVICYLFVFNNIVQTK